jgi:hypothetical protein
MTTDERFQNFGNEEWWDTTGIDIVSEAVVDYSMASNPGVGVMVVECGDKDEESESETVLKGQA